MIVRERPDELALRAEEVKYLEGSDKCRPTLSREGGALPWLMRTGMLSVGRCTKASKERIGKKCRSRRRPRRQKPCGARKQPNTERKSFMIRLAKRTFREGIKRVWSCGEEHLNGPIAALDKASKCVESQY